jgi:hypothetical protein
MAAKSKPLVLGCDAIDTATGCKGRLTIRYDQFNGNIMWALQPMVPKGKNEIPEAYFIDHFTLRRTGDGVSGSVPPIDDTVTIQIGDKVEDILTHYQGVVMEKCTYLNGCVRFSVHGEIPKDSENGLPPKGIAFEHQRLKRIGEGIPRPEGAEPEKAGQKSDKRPTGGPSFKVSSLERR